MTRVHRAEDRCLTTTNISAASAPEVAATHPLEPHAPKHDRDPSITRFGSPAVLDNVDMAEAEDGPGKSPMTSGPPA
jgi:hypothetical protein